MIEVLAPGILTLVQDLGRPGFAALVQRGVRVEPSSDAAWRNAEHGRWKRFVELAAQL